MIGGLTTLLLFQLLGELLVLVLSLPVPGPVVGMGLLFVALVVRGRVSPSIARASQGLLNHLALLFVPAGTGIIAYLALLQREWLPIAVAVIGSTVATLAVTGLVLAAMQRARIRSRDPGDPK